MDYWADSLKKRSVKDCRNAVKDWRITSFNKHSVTQPRSIMHSLRPDFVGFYLYHPKDQHHFLELISYEGKLPDRLKGKNLSQIGVDKTDLEHQNHSLGFPYYTTWSEVYLGAKVDKTGHWFYSCPVHSFDNIYIGYITIEWNKTPDLVDKDWKRFNRKLFSACQPSARQIGVFLLEEDDFPEPMYNKLVNNL